MKQLKETTILHKYLKIKCNKVINMTDRKVVSIRINPEIWKEAKRKSLDLDLTLGQFVETAILHELRKKLKR